MQYKCSAKFESYIKTCVYPLLYALKNIIVAQDDACETCILGLYAIGSRDFNVDTRERVLGSGNIILEGATGSGKTMLAKSMASLLAGVHRRISGTPDMMPSDITGCEMILLDSSKHIQHGPLYTGNIVLLDELNRLSPKGQNALLEMLSEQQVTIGEQTFKLKSPFLCIGTLNPSESHKGTARLSEALSDRFLFKVLMAQTTSTEKVEVVKRTHKFNVDTIQQILSLDAVNEAREFFFDNTYVDDRIRYYCAELLSAINNPHKYGLFSKEIELLDGSTIFKQNPPVNDRCMIFLESAAMSHAMLQARDFVVPKDVASVAARVLRGRLLLNPAAVPVLLDVNPHLHTESNLIDYLINQLLTKITI